jgi:membrane-associated phospholipid phosphatase
LERSKKAEITVKDFLKNNFVILFIYLITAGTALFFILNYEKNPIHLYLNQYVGNKFLDLFFYFITYLGDGRMAGILLLVILLYNVRLGLYSASSFLSATIVSNTLKYTLFDDVNRPFFFYQWIERRSITYVEGVDLHIHNSFPSGHATQAFAIFLCLAFTSRKQSWKLFFLALALLTSFSRVYLSQHWLADITAGSVIGLFFSLLYYSIFIYRNKLQNLNKPLSAFKK